MKCSAAKQPPLFAGARRVASESGARTTGARRLPDNNQKWASHVHETLAWAHAGRQNEPSATMAAAIKSRARNEVFCDYSRRALHNVVVGASSSFLRYTSHFNQPPVLSRFGEPLFAAAAQTARSFSEATTMAPRRVLPSNMHRADSSN